MPGPPAPSAQGWVWLNLWGLDALCRGGGGGAVVMRTQPWARGSGSQCHHPSSPGVWLSIAEKSETGLGTEGTVLSQAPPEPQMAPL